MARPHAHHHDPLEQMNTHRSEELLAIVRAFGGHPDALAVRAEDVDPGGIDVAVTTPDGPSRTRIAFPEPVTDFPAGMRLTFVRLARRARAVLAGDEA